MKPKLKACRAASRLGRTVHRALEDSQLNPAGYRLLAYLSEGASAASVLADKLAVRRPTVTTTIDWLEERGFVERTPDPVDRRRVAVAMTASGEAALRDADAFVARRLSEVLGYLDRDQATSVTAALVLLHDALDRDREDRTRRILRSPSTR
jgi:DNA-binding MarR family transcriptional regulator